MHHSVCRQLLASAACGVSSSQHHRPSVFFLLNTLQMPSFKVYLIDPLMRIISSAFIYAKQRKTASCFDLIFSPTCVLFCLFMNFCNKTVSMISLLHTASFAIIPICSVFVFIDQIVVLFNKVTQELDCSTCWITAIRIVSLEVENLIFNYVIPCYYVEKKTNLKVTTSF